MSIIRIQGVGLEVQHIAPALGDKKLAPIVFLHEGLGSLAMWRDWPQQVCQASGRDGWVYSRQGYGCSDPVAEVRGPSRTRNGQRHGRLLPDYMHHEAHSVLPALLEELGLVAPVLLGHSDGASIALLHAARHPVTACVLLAPHVMVEEQTLNAIEEARRAFETKELRKRLQRYHADVDVAFWQWNDVWLSPAFWDFDIRLDCRQILAPVLALQGLADPYGSMAQIDQILLPAHQIKRIRLPDCGHSPHRDQTETVTSHTQSFLSGLP